SPSVPPRGMSVASVSAYALTTHSNVPAVMCSSLWMEGSAMLTIVMSKRIILCEMHMATSVKRCRPRSSGTMTVCRGLGLSPRRVPSPFERREPTSAPRVNVRSSSDVVAVPHVHQRPPAPDGREVGGAEAFDEDGRHRLVLRDAGAGKPGDEAH